MKKRVGLAVNWFNYPICLSQAWFQQSCSNCGRRWQMLTWRRSTTAATTVTGASTCPPRHRQRTHFSTSMPPPTGSIWVTREKGESLHLQGLIIFLFCFLFFYLHVYYISCMLSQWEHGSLRTYKLKLSQLTPLYNWSFPVLFLKSTYSW